MEIIEIGDYNDQMCEDLVILQTCLDRRVIGAKSQQLVDKYTDYVV